MDLILTGSRPEISVSETIGIKKQLVDGWNGLTYICKKITAIPQYLLEFTWYRIVRNYSGNSPVPLIGKFFTFHR
jgi:hypothetical protein